jgi:alkylation response protein AidB-like acyl-CoA dehydrogenase
MNGVFSREQNIFRERIRSFVEREVSFSRAEEIDRDDRFPQDLMKKMADSGFMGVNIPKQYGGEGGGLLEVMIMCEEISKRCPALSWTWGNVILYGNNIIGVNGNESQRELFLPRLVRGEILFAFGLTEPDAGSDSANIKTSAEFQNGEWIINGSKMFITGGIIADVIVTLTRTAPSRYGGITSFLVDTSKKGFSRHPIKKLGFRGSDAAELVYENVRMNPSDILGGEECMNKGWPQMVRLLNGERLCLSATCLGIADAALSEAIKHFKSLGSVRIAGACQSTQHRLAEMATELEAARCLAYHAAWLHTNAMECVKETSMSKIYCAETAKKIVVSVMEIMGRDGYIMGSAVQRQLRDVLVLSIGGGTTQILKNIVTKTIGL